MLVLINLHGIPRRGIRTITLRAKTANQKFTKCYSKGKVVARTYFIRDTFVVMFHVVVYTRAKQLNHACYLKLLIFPWCQCMFYQCTEKKDKLTLMARHIYAGAHGKGADNPIPTLNRGESAILSNYGQHPLSCVSKVIVATYLNAENLCLLPCLVMTARRFMNLKKEWTNRHDFALACCSRPIPLQNYFYA